MLIVIRLFCLRHLCTVEDTVSFFESDELTGETMDCTKRSVTYTDQCVGHIILFLLLKEQRFAIGKLTCLSDVERDLV